MTQQQAFETTKKFFRQALGLNADYARLSLKYDAGHSGKTVAVDLGGRHFEVELDRSRNLIKVVEITSRRKFGWDSKTAMFGLRDISDKRVLRTARLDQF